MGEMEWERWRWSGSGVCSVVWVSGTMFVVASLSKLAKCGVEGRRRVLGWRGRARRGQVEL